MPIDIDDPNTLTPYNFNCFQPILQLIHDIAKTQLLLSFMESSVDQILLTSCRAFNDIGRRITIVMTPGLDHATLLDNHNVYSAAIKPLTKYVKVFRLV